VFWCPEDVLNPNFQRKVSISGVFYPRRTVMPPGSW
jgi:hypothetical protein